MATAGIHGINESRKLSSSIFAGDIMEQSMVAKSNTQIRGFT